MGQMLTQKQVGLIRTALTQRRSQLAKMLGSKKPAHEPIESDSQDFEISYLDSLNQEVESEIDEHHVLELQEIEATFQRMDTGEYGTCQDCGGEIDIGRLQAFPTARRCISCKQDFERQNGVA